MSGSVRKETDSRTEHPTDQFSQPDQIRSWLPVKQTRDPDWLSVNLYRNHLNMKRRSEMKNKRISSTILSLAMIVALSELPTFGQDVTASRGAGTRVNTTTRITYHDGPLMYGTSNVYFVWYGCWDETCRAGNTATKT